MAHLFGSILVIIIIFVVLFEVATAGLDAGQQKLLDAIISGSQSKVLNSKPKAKAVEDWCRDNNIVYGKNGINTTTVKNNIAIYTAVKNGGEKSIDQIASDLGIDLDVVRYVREHIPAGLDVNQQIELLEAISKNQLNTQTTLGQIKARYGEKTVINTSTVKNYIKKWDTIRNNLSKGNEELAKELGLHSAAVELVRKKVVSSTNFSLSTSLGQGVKPRIPFHPDTSSSSVRKFDLPGSPGSDAK